MTEESTALTKEEIEVILSVYPDEIADALQAMKEAELEFKRISGRRYMEFKAIHAAEKPTETHLKSMVVNDGEVYAAQMELIKAEAKHQRLYETLLSAKKLASLRTAF